VIFVDLVSSVSFPQRSRLLSERGTITSQISEVSHFYGCGGVFNADLAAFPFVATDREWADSSALFFGRGTRVDSAPSTLPNELLAIAFVATNPDRRRYPPALTVSLRARVTFSSSAPPCLPHNVSGIPSINSALPEFQGFSSMRSLRVNSPAGFSSPHGSEEAAHPPIFFSRRPYVSEATPSLHTQRLLCRLRLSVLALPWSIRVFFCHLLTSYSAILCPYEASVRMLARPHLCRVMIDHTSGLA